MSKGFELRVCFECFNVVEIQYFKSITLLFIVYKDAVYVLTH